MSETHPQCRHGVKNFWLFWEEKKQQRTSAPVLIIRYDDSVPGEEAGGRRKNEQKLGFLEKGKTEASWWGPNCGKLSKNTQTNKPPSLYRDVEMCVRAVHTGSWVEAKAWGWNPAEMSGVPVDVDQLTAGPALCLPALRSEARLVEGKGKAKSMFLLFIPFSLWRREPASVSSDVPPAPSQQIGNYEVFSLHEHRALERAPQLCSGLTLGVDAPGEVDVS